MAVQPPKKTAYLRQDATRSAPRCTAPWCGCRKRCAKVSPEFQSRGTRGPARQSDSHIVRRCKRVRGWRKIARPQGCPVDGYDGFPVRYEISQLADLMNREIAIAFATEIPSSCERTEVSKTRTDPRMHCAWTQITDSREGLGEA